MAVGLTSMVVIIWGKVERKHRGLGRKKHAPQVLIASLVLIMAAQDKDL